MKRISKYILLPLSLLLLAGVLTLSVSAANVKPKAPRITAVRNAKQGLVISWKTVEPADGYIIYRQKSRQISWRNRRTVWGDWHKISWRILFKILPATGKEKVPVRISEKERR